MAKMDERLEKMAERYCEINDLMMQSDVVSDRKTMAKFPSLEVCTMNV